MLCLQSVRRPSRPWGDVSSLALMVPGFQFTLSNMSVDKVGRDVVCVLPGSKLAEEKILLVW